MVVQSSDKSNSSRSVTRKSSLILTLEKPVFEPWKRCSTMFVNYFFKNKYLRSQMLKNGKKTTYLLKKTEISIQKAVVVEIL